ncbi:MAG TPA: cytochrome c [Gaiellaceae bacterium]|nr:cytochrome c [Gaiellaceae bacterium]
MRSDHWLPVVSGALLLAAFGALAAADERPTYSAAEGRHTFETFCTNCHGSDGRGDGYMVSELKTRPADLTRLAEHHGGVFPEDEVRRAIDGRTEIRAHGRRDMPVWGDIFVWPEHESAERRAEVEQRIGELVAYVRTLQAPVQAPPGD